MSYAIDAASSVVYTVFLPCWRLRSFYWYLRQVRFDADRRRYYRRVQAERRKLVQQGFDPEAIRLYCLHLADPSREVRLVRLASYLNSPVFRDSHDKSNSPVSSDSHDKSVRPSNRQTSLTGGG
jgi:hypothetical protein